MASAVVAMRSSRIKRKTESASSSADWLLGQRGARLVSPESMRQELYMHFYQRQVELFP